MRILLVEDDPDVARFLEEAMARAGHEPTSFGHGGLALGAIARGKYELLVCDLMLPNVSGLDIIRMMRSQFPYLPIIAISAHEGEYWEQQARDAGANCFIAKPIRMERLLEEVKLVQQCQVDLSIGILDQDPRHVERVQHELNTLGCDTQRWPSIVELMEQHESLQDMRVLLVDAALQGAKDAIGWAAGRNIAAVVFDDEHAEFNQDEFMRAGASFCLFKPIDTDYLVTQARFFVSPVPKRQAV